MAATSPTLITTGVEVYDDAANIVWKIQNFPTVQQDASLVSKQHFEYETEGPNSSRCQWLIGLEVEAYGRGIGMFFKLVGLQGPNSPVSVKVTLDLKNPDGSAQWSKQSVRTLSAGQKMNMGNVLAFNQPVESWETLMDGKNALHFEIDMKILVTTAKRETYDAAISCTTGLIENFKKMFIENLQGNYAALLTDESSADLKIVCSDGKEFSAHSIILAARCPVFKSMLSPESKFSETQEGVIKINDISGKTMKILLNYFYTGDVSSDWSDPDTIHEFTYAAGKYQLTQVLKMLDTLIGTGDESTCNMLLLNLVNELGLKNAETQLVQRIVKRTNAIKNCADLFVIYGYTNANEKKTKNEQDEEDSNN